eukprot:2928388-Alexandrium_andersonii.AAC.1
MCSSWLGNWPAMLRQWARRRKQREDKPGVLSTAALLLQPVIADFLWNGQVACQPPCGNFVLMALA